MVPRLRKEDRAKGRALLEEALTLLGEDDFKMTIIDMGRIQFTIALTFLHSQKWWVKNLTMAVELGQQSKTTFLCRLIDKFIPNAGTAKPQEDVRDTFVVQYMEMDNAILPKAITDAQ